MQAEGRRDIADIEARNIQKRQVWLRRPVDHEDFRQIEQRLYCCAAAFDANQGHGGALILADELAAILCQEPGDLGDECPNGIVVRPPQFNVEKFDISIYKIGGRPCLPL